MHSYPYVLVGPNLSCIVECRSATETRQNMLLPWRITTSKNISERNTSQGIASLFRYNSYTTTASSWLARQKKHNLTSLVSSGDICYFTEIYCRPTNIISYWIKLTIYCSIHYRPTCFHKFIKVSICSLLQCQGLFLIPIYCHGHHTICNKVYNIIENSRLWQWFSFNLISETEHKDEDNEYLAELCSDLAEKYKENQLDAYLLYL